MTAPFTIAEFLGVFVAYNAAIWPAQIVAYLLGVVAVAALWLKQLRLILAILALMWLGTGIGYHYLFFASINPAAPLFAGFFVMQAVLFAACAVAPRKLSFCIGRDLRTGVGFASIIYAMIIYPALGLWTGHGFMAGPMFGVAPCPTTIFTIGMLLLLAHGRWVVWLSVVPVLWSAIGLAAALQLGMFEDFALPVAGFLLLLVLARARPPKKELHSLGQFP